tara:strand:- start:1124 stop:1291 length:168 start_codon:yes stop_codon:yes gene_type:complete
MGDFNLSKGRNFCASKSFLSNFDEKTEETNSYEEETKPQVLPNELQFSKDNPPEN